MDSLSIIHKRYKELYINFCLIYVCKSGASTNNLRVSLTLNLSHHFNFLSRYPRERYLDESSAEDFTQKWPTFVDMTGFQNADDGNIRKTLDFIINGCLKDGSKLNTSLQNKRYPWIVYFLEFSEDDCIRELLLIFTRCVSWKSNYVNVNCITNKIKNCFIFNSITNKIKIV